MANDYANYPVDPTAEAGKQELIFKLTAFKTTGKYTDYQAFAIKLQELLLMEPGTHPDALGMGVGIRNSLMDLLDSATIDDLTRRTEQQIATYLPNNMLKKIEFIKNGKEGDRNQLYLFVHINKEDENFANNFFAIGFGNDGSKTRETISSIHM
jgi:hypothetical protein